MSVRAIRASELRVGDTFEDPGMEPETVRSRDDHGDTVLITTDDDLPVSLDGDTVVFLYQRVGDLP